MIVQGGSCDAQEYRALRKALIAPTLPTHFVEMPTTRQSGPLGAAQVGQASNDRAEPFGRTTSSPRTGSSSTSTSVAVQVTQTFCDYVDGAEAHRTSAPTNSYEQATAPTQPTVEEASEPWLPVLH